MGRSRRKPWQKPRRTPSVEPPLAVEQPAAESDPEPASEAEAAASSPAGSAPAKGIRHLVPIQIEDLILLVWIVLVERMVQSAFGQHLQTVATLGAAPKWVYVVVFGGLAIVFYTRGPADVDMNEATSRRCVLGLLGWFVARDYFSGSPDWGSKAFVVAVVVVLLVAPLGNLSHLPRTSLGLRRALVLPAQLVGNSVFSGIITPGFMRGAELPGTAPEYRWAASLVLSAFLFLYVIVAPRVMAGGDWRPFAWLVRFGSYWTALWLGRPAWLQYGW
jgi:hypothetical protein